MNFAKQGGVTKLLRERYKNEVQIYNNNFIVIGRMFVVCC